MKHLPYQLIIFIFVVNTSFASTYMQRSRQCAELHLPTDEQMMELFEGSTYEYEGQELSFLEFYQQTDMAMFKPLPYCLALMTKAKMCAFAPICLGRTVTKAFLIGCLSNRVYTAMAKGTMMNAQFMQKYLKCMRKKH
ncbi:MAG: hypothetical protein ISR65_10605 [Bacteriovoracaceae bacterium]|nr:hypothetical protein [Bacteriovoracaceae bacterium]